jgi:hypothetical protein
VINIGPKTQPLLVEWKIRDAILTIVVLIALSSIMSWATNRGEENRKEALATVVK